MNMSANAFRLSRLFCRDLPNTAVGIVVGFIFSFVISALVPPSVENANHDHALQRINEITASNHNKSLSHPPSSTYNLLENEEPLRDLLYVGVLSAGRFLRTRIAACNRTWGQDVPDGDMQFFVGTAPTEPYPKRSVVTLEGVSDHEYPPQRKAFRMLQYMCDNHLDKYNWFLRADDDAYFRIAKIKKWLSNRDPNVKYYIGQAGYGRDLDKGRLHLPGDDNFCMGGPGVIMSRAAMQGICPYIERCMQDNVTRSTGEEDVEIGRCFTKHLNVLCTSAYEFMDLFYHSYPQEYSVHPYLYRDNRAVKVFQNALTLHHIKISYVMYDVHTYFNLQHRTEWHEQALALVAASQKISEARMKSPPGEVSSVEMPSVASLDSITPLEATSTLVQCDSEPVQPDVDSTDWVYIDPEGGVDLSASPSNLIVADSAARIARITDITRRAIAQQKLRFEKVLRMWTHSDPSVGRRYLIEASAQKFIGRNSVRSTYQVELCQALNESEVTSVAAASSEESEVLIILPMTNVHIQFFQRFMKMYEVNFLADQTEVGAETPGKAHLFVVLFPDYRVNVNGFERAEGVFDPAMVVSLYQNKYPHVHMHVVTAARQMFSPVVALSLGLEYMASAAAGNIQKNSVVLMTSVDLHLSPGFVSDCQNRVHQQDATVFPVVSVKPCSPSTVPGKSAELCAPGSGVSETWLPSSYVHMCGSYKKLSSTIGKMNGSSHMENFYQHLVSLSRPADGGVAAPTFRVYDSSLKIEHHTSHQLCGALVKSVPVALAVEILPACSKSEVR